MKKSSIKLEKQTREANDLDRKAAAWAWYQHGRRRANRIDTLSTKFADFGSGSTAAAVGQQVSRFKTEAEKPDTSALSAGRSLALLSLLPREEAQKCFQKDRKDGKQNDSPWDCGSTLYDSFELLSLSNQLGRCLTTVHAIAAPTPEYLPHPRMKFLPNKPDILRAPSIPRNLAIPQCFAIPKDATASPLLYPFAARPITQPSQNSHDPKEKSSLRKALQSLLRPFGKVPEPKKSNGIDKASDKENLLKKKKGITGKSLQEYEHEHFHHHHHYYHHHHHHYRNEMIRSPSTTGTRKMLQPGLSSAFLPKEFTRVMLPISVPRR